MSVHKEACMESRDIVGLGPFGWLGDYPNSLSQAPERHKYGVYLWAIPYKDQYLVHYAGKAMQQTFEVRLKQEAKWYKDSSNRIYDGARFAQGERVLLWKGHWTKDSARWQAEEEVFRQREPQLAPHRQVMLKALRFLLLPISDQRVEFDSELDRLAKRTERALWRVLEAAGDRVASFLASG